MLPLQQPFGQDVASQTHWPLFLLHSWVAAQGAQVAPDTPQEPLDSDAYASHVPLAPPVQQPLGQVLASHAQTPVVRSHRLFAHGPHAAPPLPHCEPVCDANCTHTLPLQHPFGHELASHTHAPVLRLHSWPIEHGAQAAPAAPQELYDSDP